jgi:hypothetical protein
MDGRSGVNGPKGGAYYLGPTPLEKIVIALTRYPGLFEGEYYEDKLIGDVLMFEGVELKRAGRLRGVRPIADRAASIQSAGQAEIVV